MRYEMFLICLFIVACSTTRKGAVSKQALEPQVLTILLEMTQNSDGKSVFELTDIIKADGYVKDKPVNQPNFKFIFLDTDNQPVIELSKRIQAIQSIEYVNEDGQLSKKRIKNKKTTIPIRINMQPNLHTLQIYNLKEPHRVLSTFPLIKTNS